MDDYSKLKLLLLEEERHKIDELEALLQKSIQESSDAHIIVQKIAPLLSDILSKTIEENKAKFVTIFAPLMGDMLENTIENSGEKIAKIISPIISSAIKDQVKNDKDGIIDALYPVIGNMISKFVSQSFKDLLDEINSKVQSTLSYETIKRKIIAKIKGVSETELLLQSSQKLHKVESVFLIHKVSGILISERSLKDHESIEPEMVASMLSAIRSFVNDWISKNSNHLELNEIEFGNYTIYLEVAGCCYLAVVLSGNSNLKLQNKITSLLEVLVKKYSDAIMDFDGDRSKIPLEEINQKLDTLLEEEVNVEDKKTKKSYVGLSLLFLFIIILVGIFSYVNYSNQLIQKKIEKSLAKDPYVNIYDIQINVEYKKVTVTAKLPYETLHQKVIQDIKSTLKRRSVEDKIVLTHVPLTTEEIKKEIEISLKSINIVKGNRLKYKLHKNKVTLNGIIQDRESYEKILNHLSSLDGIDKIISDVVYNFSKTDLQLYYETAKYDLTQEKQELLDLWMQHSRVEETLELFDDFSLIVMGFSDAKGSIVNNLSFAQKRAQNVYNYLIKKGVKSSQITFIASPIPPKDMMNEKNHHGRLVKIKWIKK